MISPALFYQQPFLLFTAEFTPYSPEDAARRSAGRPSSLTTNAKQLFYRDTEDAARRSSTRYSLA